MGFKHVWERGDMLPKDLQEECKRRFIYRMTKENVKQNPQLLEIMGGDEEDLMTDEEWIKRTDFAIEDGELSNRVNYCSSHYNIDKKTSTCNALLIPRPSGKATCVICNNIIREHEDCIKIKVNARAEPFFHAECLKFISEHAIACLEREKSS